MQRTTDMVQSLNDSKNKFIFIHKDVKDKIWTQEKRRNMRANKPVRTRSFVTSILRPIMLKRTHGGRCFGCGV